MYTQISWRQMFLAPILILVLISGLFVSTPQAHAQINRDVMLAQMQQLLTIIASMQQQLLQMESGTLAVVNQRGNVALTIGSRIQTTRIINVRSGPGFNTMLLNTADAFSQGQIVDGPRFADGFTWWLIKYDNGTQGWSSGNALVSIGTPMRVDPPVVDTQADKEVVRDVTGKIVIPAGGGGGSVSGGGGGNAGDSEHFQIH